MRVRGEAGRRASAETSPCRGGRVGELSVVCRSVGRSAYPDRVRGVGVGGWVTPPATQYYLYNRIIATPSVRATVRASGGRGGRPGSQPAKRTDRPPGGRRSDLQRQNDTDSACQLAAPATTEGRVTGGDPARCHPPGGPARPPSCTAVHTLQ